MINIKKKYAKINRYVSKNINSKIKDTPDNVAEVLFKKFKSFKNRK